MVGTQRNLWSVSTLLLLLLVACSQTKPAVGGGGFALPDSEGQPITGSDVAAQSDVATDPDAVADPDAAGDAQSADDAAPTGDDAYDGPACTTGSACKDYKDKHLCATSIKQCVQCLTEFNCGPNQVCENFVCKDPSCAPGTATCDGNFLVTCGDDGKSTTTTKCPDEAPTCVVDKCQVCTPNSKYCAAPSVGGKSKAVMQCGSDGTSATVAEACEGDAVCLNKQCMVCAPGTKLCQGDVAMACNDAGTGMEPADDCGAKGQACLGGLCVNPCQGDIKSNTYVGCDFWAVDLDNAIEASGGTVYDAQNQQYAVVVSNTASGPAAVTVSFGTKGQANYKSKTYSVPAKALQVINLPDPSWGMKPQNQDGTSINALLYRIQADQPIVAYQFNPLANYGVFSNDASLLLPSTSLGKTYYVMSRRQLADKYRSYVNVIATQPGDTTVAVKVTAKTLAGPGVPSLKKGAIGTYTLKQGQALNLESDEPDGDMTGTYVEADKAVAVFGGSEASNSPDTGSCIAKASGAGKACAGTSNSGFPQSCTADSGCQSSCCADHLEEQMFPIDTLGASYVAGHLQARGKEKDAWRFLAVQDGTTVTLQPSQGVNIPTLNKGAWFEVQSSQDFVITANKPILVGQYMASSYATLTTEGGTCTVASQCQSKYGFVAECLSGGFQNYCAPIGDPSLILAAATSQFLDDYIFLVPDKYKTNYVNIVLPAGATAKIDNAVVAASNFQAIPNTLWTVARLSIPAGSHRLQLSAKGSLTVYGYDKDVSYGYTGGAGLAVSLTP